MSKVICNFCGLKEDDKGAKDPCTSALAEIQKREKGYQANQHAWIEPSVRYTENPQATRTPLNVRYDLLEASFLRAMAQVGQHGAEKFGEGNYKLSRMKGKDSPANHIMNHLGSYMLHEQYNHPEIGHDRKYHLAAIAFNAMMEYFYEEQEKKGDTRTA